MAGEGIITIAGNIGNNAELRTTSNGTTVATFSLANTPRIKKDGEWSDGETVWYRCAIWGRDAETAAANIVRGARVIVTGRLQIITYEEKLQININVDDYGIKPRNANASVNNDGNISDDDPWA